MQNQSLLIIGSVFPEPTSSAAGSRMMQLIEQFKSLQWQITFVSTAAKSSFSVDLEYIGIITKEIKLNDPSFDTFIDVLKPTIILFDRFMTEEQFGWRVAESCPNAIRILDTEDLHSLRHARHKALKENKTVSEDFLISDYSKREIASILRCDVSLIISKYEMELLKNFFKVDERLLYYIPFMLDAVSDEQQNGWMPFDERKHFISIGNFLHEPNWDAVQFLKKEIWPLIKKQLPQAELHIYGAYSSQKVFELNNVKEGFIIKGRAENVAEVMQKAKVCLAPLRFGAGLKGKLIDAMLAGTPSVTTSVGAEAMHENLPWSGNIANTATEFANAAVTLYSNKTEWEIAQQNGIAIINKCYSKKLFGDSLIDRITSISDNLEKHRQNNFMGAMLLHHTLNSTKYMSKWIEEKNKH